MPAPLGSAADDNVLLSLQLKVKTRSLSSPDVYRPPPAVVAPAPHPSCYPPLASLRRTTTRARRPTPTSSCSEEPPPLRPRRCHDHRRLLVALPRRMFDAAPLSVPCNRRHARKPPRSTAPCAIGRHCSPRLRPRCCARQPDVSVVCVRGAE